MGAICDSHKKKVDVELLYNLVDRKFNELETRYGRESQAPSRGSPQAPDWAVGDQTSWGQDAVEKASTQQREPSGPRLISSEIRRVGEKILEWEHVPERLGPQVPGWPAQENGKETRLWPIKWGSICCCSVRSPTPSLTQPFQ